MASRCLLTSHYAVLLRSTGECGNIAAFAEWTRHESVCAILGLHVLHSGRILAECKLPYALVCGGTDVNVVFSTAEMLIMERAVAGARWASFCLLLERHPPHPPSLPQTHTCTPFTSPSNMLFRIIITFNEPMRERACRLWPTAAVKCRVIPQGARIAEEKGYLHVSLHVRMYVCKYVSKYLYM